MKIMMEVLFHYFDNLLYTHQTKGVNILNWLKMRTNFYAQMCNVQSMKKQKNTGSIFLILEIIIIIIIIIIITLKIIGL